MAESALVNRLDDFVNAVLARGDATAALRDERLAPLVRLAAELRHYPRAQFKARLRATLARAHRAAITPYVEAREPGLVDFLARVFGAVETRSARESAGVMLRHLRIGDSTIVVGEGEHRGDLPLRTGEFHVYVEDADAAFERARAAGAESLGAPADRPYGERAGFVRDPFGNLWFIATYLGGSHVPEGLGVVTPFVHARGAARYIDFLTRAFGALEEQRHEVGGGIVRYARVRIGGAPLEIGEAEPAIDPRPGAFFLSVGDPSAAYERAVAAGAKPLTTPADAREERIARVEDPAGNHWFISRAA